MVRPAGATTGGLRGGKGTVYEGGIRVPAFVRWPGKIAPGSEIHRIAAHIDLMPTILSACGVDPPAGVKLDGKDLLPLLLGKTSEWPQRTLYFQWHRGDAVEAGRNCAAVTQKYKLVQPKWAADGPAPNATWELYDLAEDPAEGKNLAESQPQIFAALRAGYDAWFADVSATRGYGPVPIHLGTEHENPVLLTRQDRRGGTGTSTTEIGHWAVHVAAAESYSITLMFEPAAGVRTAHLQLGNAVLDAPVGDADTQHTFENVPLESGDARLTAWVGSPDARKGVTYVHVARETHKKRD